MPEGRDPGQEWPASDAPQQPTESCLTAHWTACLQPLLGEQLGAADAQYPPAGLLALDGRMMDVPCKLSSLGTMQGGTVPHRARLSVRDMLYVASACVNKMSACWPSWRVCDSSVTLCHQSPFAVSETQLAAAGTDTGCDAWSHAHRLVGDQGLR